MKSCITIFFALLLSSSVFAQSQISNTRILFLLDGSGSMLQKFEGKSKYETAVRLIYELSDSLEKAKSKVQIGVRLFGHQFSREAHKCEDSRLEIPFSSTNAVNIKYYLNKITPKGFTPIAYSIFQAAQNDFGLERNGLNAIILITDGEETCGGNPCAAAQMLEQKRISLKPFIIGLKLDDSLKSKFDCIGTYFDASTENGFSNILRTVLSQINQNTTVQINLLNQNGDATESNVELTFSDTYNGDLRYSFVHSFNDNGNSDTLRIDPIGKYEIKVHTLPPVTKSNIVLKPGRHNIFGIDAAQGLLQLTITGTPNAQNIGNTPVCVIRKANTTEIVNVQECNSTIKYLVGNYDLEILTTPKIDLHDVPIKPGENKNITIPSAGTISVSLPVQGFLSIYQTNLNRWEKVYDWGKISAQSHELNLQPGEYDIVYKPENKSGSEYTQTKRIKVNSGKLLNVIFK